LSGSRDPSGKLGPANWDAPLTAFTLFLKTVMSILKEADWRLEKAAGLSASNYIVLMVLEMNRGHDDRAQDGPTRWR